MNRRIELFVFFIACASMTVGLTFFFGIVIAVVVSLIIVPALAYILTRLLDLLERRRGTISPTTDKQEVENEL